MSRSDIQYIYKLCRQYNTIQYISSVVGFINEQSSIASAGLVPWFGLLVFNWTPITIPLANDQTHVSRLLLNHVLESDYLWQSQYCSHGSLYLEQYSAKIVLSTWPPGAMLYLFYYGMHIVLAVHKVTLSFHLKLTFRQEVLNWSLIRTQSPVINQSSD